MKKAEATQPNFYHSVGRRKTAVAQVRLQTGTGQFMVNHEKIAPDPSWTRPLQLTGKNDSTDISVIVRGGGISSQSQAIILGIARALVAFDASFKSTLRKAGFITVDARVKERKKPGLKRARKAPQWAKR